MKPQHELHKNWLRKNPVFLFSYEDKDIYSWDEDDRGNTVYAAMFPDHERSLGEAFYFSPWYIDVGYGEPAAYHPDDRHALFPPEVLEIINAHRNLLA